MSGLDDGTWHCMTDAPKDGTEVELLLRHVNYRYCKTDDERAKWEQAVRSTWIDFNGGEWSLAKTFEELGIPRDVRMRLAQAIRHFSNELSSLLDMVYFHTEPMRAAVPGQVLSFQNARKINFKADIKPIKILVTDTKKAARIRELAKAIGTEYSQASKGIPPSFRPPIRDEHFALAANGSGDEPLTGQYSAELSFREG